MARGQEYVRAKAQEALDATDGNRHEASLLLRVWAEADAKLYKALTAPLLGNLAALAVQRVVAPQTQVGRQRKPIREAELLAAIGSRNGQSMASTRTVGAPPQGSVRHKQAVTLLASAYRRKPAG
ncbi:MAG: hypothetical protein RLO51_03105 [Thalassobaculum sp.]|uniref:hypothetical protein n=1 Tax=Thalassobaculum sp. TaxID=2022740 RepID=UPI0032EC0996